MKQEKMERMQMYMLHKHQGVPMCCNCVHFRIHYVRNGRGYRQIPEGHCVEPRLKARAAWDLCRFFTPIAASSPAPIQTK